MNPVPKLPRPSAPCPRPSAVADLVVENTIILELKAVTQLIPVHEAQLLNYLKLSHLPVGYLFNFNGIRLEWKRFANTLGYS
ncbi:MAG: GxxExxY protein [Spirochaetales bacterium]|nr:GxxExxY protein [Spirochaetales bacterium]